MTAAAKATVAPVAAKPKSVLGAIESVASKSPAGSLLLSASVRAAAGAVKSAADFGKQDAFDREALRLASDEKAVLHYHDHPSTLSKQELAGMVFAPSSDGQRAHGATGTWFIGMAKRRGT